MYISMYLWKKNVSTGVIKTFGDKIPRVVQYKNLQKFCKQRGSTNKFDLYRFVVDLRQLNARTKSLQYMVPELGEMWAKLRNAKF